MKKAVLREYLKSLETEKKTTKKKSGK